MWWQRKSNQLAIIYSIGVAAIGVGVLVKNLIIYVLPIAIALAYFSYRKRKTWLVVLFLLLAVGYLRGSYGWPDFGQDTISTNYGYGNYYGVVVEEPTIKVDKSLIIVSLYKKENNGTEEFITGKAQIEADRFLLFKIGDEIKVSCKFVPAKNKDGSWQMWLLKDGITAKCFNAKIKKIDEKKDIIFHGLNKLIWLKEKATKVTKEILPEPYSSLLAGILWGARAGLSDSIQETMKRAGITHIIAISGFNISLITVALAGWLMAVGLSRKKAVIIIIVVLIVFVILTGASASVVRAALMGGLVVFIRIVQRKVRAVVVLPFVLLLMSLISPLSLLYDAGLHLSFLATVGLMVINPQFEKILPSNFPVTLKDSLITTLSATLMTAPYCWWQFGQLTLAGLISNLIVVPLVPWVMATGALAVCCGFVSTIIALPLAFVTKFILSVILWTAELTSVIPTI